MTRDKAKELWPIIKAYAEGKTIQFRQGGEWFDYQDNLGNFKSGLTYRIKPETKLTTIEPISTEDLKEDNDVSHNLRDTVQTMKNYQPFKDCDELKKCYLNRYVKKVGFKPVDCGLDVPYIWVKSKAYGVDNLITAFDNNNESISGSCVFVQDIWVDMKELLDCFTFLDGSPCGVEDVL